MAIEEINAAGGIKAMGGAKLEGLLSDSQSRPEVGVSEVERLHQEGVSAYMGCFASGIALPATQAAAKYNTPFLIDVGASDLIVNRGLKNVFRLMPGFSKSVDDAIVALGEINKAANNEYVLLARTLHQQKVDLAGMFSVLGGGFNYKLVQELPDVAQNMMDFNLWFNPRSARAQDMKKRVEAKGSLFTFEVYMAYSTIRLYADALQRAATADKEKVIAALESSTFSDHFLPYGPTKFVNGQNQGGRGTLQQATKTDIEVVWPNEFASTKVVYPRPKMS